MEETKKKRIRKKTCEIDSLEKLKSNTQSNNKVPEKKKKEKKEVQKEVPKEVPVEVDESKSHSQISFGKFNITVKKKETMSAEEIREYYDKKFKIDDSEKTAKLMVQEDDLDAVYEPMTEDDFKADVKKVRVKQPNRSNVNRVLSKFIDNVEIAWPESTDILCWWCCHPFDTIPIPCPVNYDEIRDRYEVTGVFCSWSCSAAYSVEEYRSLDLIYQMKNGLCGYSEDIAISPPRYCLKNFGGYMSIKDYRAFDTSKTLLISTEGLSYINTEIMEIKHS